MLQLDFDINFGDLIPWLTDPWIVGWVLIGSGILGAAWLLENMTDPIPLLGTIFDILVKLGTFVGFFIGFLDILVGYVVFVNVPEASVVAGVLIIIGFTLIRDGTTYNDCNFFNKSTLKILKLTVMDIYCFCTNSKNNRNNDLRNE